MTPTFQPPLLDLLQTLRHRLLVLLRGIFLAAFTGINRRRGTEHVRYPRNR
jgi:hypothetical protein